MPFVIVAECDGCGRRAVVARTEPTAVQQVGFDLPNGWSGEEGRIVCWACEKGGGRGH